VIPEEEEVIRKILVKLATRIQDLEKEVKRYQGLLAIDQNSPSSSPFVHNASTNVSEPVINLADDAEGVEDLAKRLSQVSFSIPSKTHIGESSAITLMLAAMDQREKIHGASLPDWNTIFAYVRRPEYWERNPVSEPLVAMTPNGLIHSLLVAVVVKDCITSSHSIRFPSTGSS